MYKAILSSTSPTIGFNSHGIATANSFSTKLRPFPATRCFIDEDLESNVHGFSVKRRLLETPSSLAALTGNFRALAAVEALERPSVDISKKTGPETAIIPALELGGGSDGGRGDGDGGRIGGGLADRGNDDDECEDDDGDGGGGGEELWLFWRRGVVAELFDGETIEAVLSEWMRKMKDLPLAIKEAWAMGILSSAELTKYLWFNLRPSVARLLPQGLITELNGKVMADPLLPHKLGFEAVCSVCWSVCVDFCSRKTQRTKRDWDLTVANAVINAICNVFAVWSLAPCNELINLPKLPNNVNRVFEKSRRVRNFGVHRRLLCFLHKAVAFFALGFAAKSAARIYLSTEKISAENLGTLSKESLAAGISFGLFSNLRYQLVWGIDRSLDLYFDVTKVSLAFCLALRSLNIGLGTLTLNWFGSEKQVNCPDLVDSLMSHVGDGLSCGYDRWFGLRNFIATGFSLVDTSTKTQLVAKKRG